MACSGPGPWGKARSGVLGRSKVAWRLRSCGRATKGLSTISSKGIPMVRRSILAMFTVLAIVLGGVVVSTPAGAVVDTAVIVPSPNVGTNRNELYSVSCVSVSFCVATGFYNNGSAHQTLVEHWDGVSWTVVSSPNVGTSFNDLRSVSCVSVSFCVATGLYTIGGSTVQTLVEHWDGVSWTVVTSPNVGTNTNELYSVSCVSVSFCVATGFYNNGSALQTLVEHWDGVSWTVVSSPNVSTNTNELRSVSCVSVSFCVATGLYTIGGSTPQTLVGHWNGASWAVVSSPNVGTSFNMLESVSCVSASFCVATGVHGGGSPFQTLVEHWDGVSWTVVPSPNVGVIANLLLSVSCVSVSFCVATGTYDGVLPVQTLVQHWDGVSWTVVSSPNDGTTSLLRSVSCVSATECVAVGSTNTGNANQTLVVSLTGPELAPSDQVSPAFTG